MQSNSREHYDHRNNSRSSTAPSKDTNLKRRGAYSSLPWFRPCRVQPLTYVSVYSSSELEMCRSALLLKIPVQLFYSAMFRCVHTWCLVLVSTIQGILIDYAPVVYSPHSLLAQVGVRIVSLCVSWRLLPRCWLSPFTLGILLLTICSFRDLAARVVRRVVTLCIAWCILP